MITRNTDYSIQRLRGLSTDTKPTDVPNGSEFREMDTGKKFLYSAAGTEWIEQPGSGGSGGGGSVKPLMVNINNMGTDNESLDKTWQEIYDALATGVPAFVHHVSVPDREVGMGPILSCSAPDDNKYIVIYLNGVGIVTTFKTDNSSGYPIISE